MPTPAAEEPLEPISVKLFKRDVRFLKSHYKQGWTTKVRDIVRQHLKIQRLNLNKQEEVLRYDGRSQAND